MKKKMKVLVKESAGPGIAIRHANIPELGPHDVLVKNQAVSICGTDLHIYNWDRWAAARIKPPLIIGHEMSGIVVKKGPAVTSRDLGDYVSLECHYVCGQCYQCKTGKAHICSDYSILGVDFNGCFAEYVSVPENNLWENNRQVPPELACLLDPAGNAVMTATFFDITGKIVMITGCGSIGLIAVGVASVLGAKRVLALDINDYRLNLARRMGATVTINPDDRDPVQSLLAETGGEGVDVLLEMSGSEQRLRDGLRVVKNGGCIALLGIFEDRVTLDLTNEVIFKGVTLAGISGREIFGTWYKTSALLSSVLDISPIVTHHFKLEEYEEAFRVMNSGQCGKIVLFPW